MDNSGYYCDQQPSTFAGGESGDSFYTTAFASRGLSASHEQVILPPAPTNAQKTRKNGGIMGEIRPKRFEGRELTKDQLAVPLAV